MKPANFRIGNFVETPDGIQPIIEISQHAVYTADFKSTWAEIKPIPLTEDWLKIFGFERKDNPNNTPSWIWIKKGQVWFYQDWKGCDFYINSFINTYSQKEVKFIHELQNLYFALTGEELTLKEEVKP